MKYKKLTLIIGLLICSQLIIVTSAQQATLATGGDASGPDGSISYSIGQVITTTISGSTGSVAQGVQNPYEFWAVIGTCEGDADGNGIVNILDLVVISGNFGCSTGCTTGDANFDGVVNILDLVATSSNFGAICP